MTAGGPVRLTVDHETVTSILGSLRALPGLDDSDLDPGAMMSALVCLGACDAYLKAALAGGEPSSRAARRRRGVGDELVRMLHEVNEEMREDRRARVAESPSA